MWAWWVEWYSRSKKQTAAYLTQLQTNFGSGSKAYLNAKADPSNDNFHNYRGDDLDQQNQGILARYKNYNNPQGNSPVAGNNAFSSAATMYPDAEGLKQG